jgi:hypothetical protein
MNTSDTEEYDEPTEESPANNPPIEREEGHSKFMEGIFWPLILIIALLIAGAVTWLIATPFLTKPSPPPPPSEDATTSPATTTQSKTATESSTSSKNKLKPAEEPPKLAPPPPEVYWSILSQQLLDLEQERVTILNLLGQKSPLPLPEPKSEETQHNEPEKITIQKQDNNSETAWLSTPKTVQTNTEISWTTVSQQLLELEQERERTLSLLANKIKTNNDSMNNE